MTREETLACVLDVLRNDFDLAAKAAVPTARLGRDLGLDSIDAIALAARLEQETGLLLKEERLRRLRTVQDIAYVVFEVHGQRRA